MFVVRRCVLFVVYVLFAKCCCLSCNGRCALFVVCCSVSVDSCLLFVVAG